MASLILAAEAAREDARRLRSDASELRVAVRRSVRLANVRTEKAAAATEIARARREIPVASPWSGLHWRLEHESLERILLPLD